jgi:hypothetical protein
MAQTTVPGTREHIILKLLCYIVEQTRFCLNRTNRPVPSTSGLDKFYCSSEGFISKMTFLAGEMVCVCACVRACRCMRAYVHTSVHSLCMCCVNNCVYVCTNPMYDVF